jgi:hypothetical protein
MDRGAGGRTVSAQPAGIDLATATANLYRAIMFPTVATVKHVQKDVENNRFHAKAEVTLK